MKSISLYVDKDTYLTRMHPFTKLCYIVTAIAASLISGKLTVFGVFIGISLVTPAVLLWNRTECTDLSGLRWFRKDDQG